MKRARATEPFKRALANRPAGHYGLKIFIGRASHPEEPVMMRIIVLSVFGALLAACSGSTRVEDILRANMPTQEPFRKSQTA
jgi:hypothetical protein